jgi:glycosyltransferase involved in cell wall biosynthesis/2-polyprenyl-3-methyl-5-hydroxy-6-metoxy-1,4-benzoquinol methylase
MLPDGRFMVAAVTFIIPAYRSGQTLGRTLASIAAQTVRDWEAIIVHDGAGDPGLAVSSGWAARDPRIRSFEQPHGGAARARNNAIARSSSEWLVFLDADDTIAPAFLKLMLGKARRLAAAGRPVDVVACGFDRLDQTGRVSARVPPLPLDEDALAICAAGPPGAIHSFLVRRLSVVEAGGFDEELVTNEDWDLWLRVARGGGRFATVDRQLAFYWPTPGSLSRAGGQMIRDAAIVTERARAMHRKPSQGLEAFDRRHVASADLAMRNAFWSAGVAIGHGQRTDELLAHLSWGADLRMQKTHLVDRLVDGLVVGSGVGYPQLATAWPRFMADTATFVDAVVRRCAGHGDAAAALDGSFGLMALIQITIARYGRFRGVIDLGKVAAVMLGPRHLLRGYDPPDHVDVVVLRLPWLRPATLFSFAVPAVGRLSPRDMARAVRGETRRRLLGRVAAQDRAVAALARLHRIAALGRRVMRVRRAGLAAEAPYAARRMAEERARIHADALLACDLPVRQAPAPGRAHPGAGSSAAEWEAFFADEDPWNYGSAYEQQKYRRTLAMIPPMPEGGALEIACAEGRFTELLAPHVRQLTAVDISATAIGRAARRTAHLRNIHFRQHDLFAGQLSGSFDLITCSEMLYFAPSAAALARVAGQIAGALRPGGHFVHAHAYAVVDTPGRTGFDWGNAFGAGSIHAAFAAEPRLALLRTIETELYRIDLFQRVCPDEVRPAPITEYLPIDTPLDPQVAADIVWNGAIRTRAAVARHRAYRLPVLALDGIGADRLETMLRFLRRRGFRSVTPLELAEGAEKAASLRGRPILLTADWEGGKAGTIWPIVRRSGFGLHAFAATDLVADWRAVLDHAAEGVTFGSALASGRAADALSSPALIDEAVRSRLTLQHVLRAPVTTIAPAGLSDTRIEQLIAAAGYTRLFVPGERPASITLHPLQTPRIRVSDAMTLTELAALIGRDIEPPDALDGEGSA